MEQRATPRNDHKENSWLMTQAWKDVLFLHWPVSKEELRKHVPAELELDLYNDQAWISLVLFKVEGTRPRLMPSVPPVSNYLELNVRTYVKHGKKPGIYFFSLDASSDLVVSITRLGDFLPYMKAKMDFVEDASRFAFTSHRVQEDAAPEALTVGYKPQLETLLDKQEIDRFLTERYTLWTKPKDSLFRLDITHPEWDLYPVEFQIEHNTMASFIPFTVEGDYPLAHYSPGVKPLFFPPMPVETDGEKFSD